MRHLKFCYISILTNLLRTVKYFSWYIAIQIWHATEKLRKGLSFIKQLICKFFIIDFY